MLPVIVIPAYQPDETLLQLVHELMHKQPTQQFIIVDDGSTTASAANVFQQLSQLPGITLLQHANNLGKGQALKSAFNYFLKHYQFTIGLVTADADGQHLAEDIIRLQCNLVENDQKLWLGVRQFSKDSIPFRSFFGNQLTRKAYGWFSGYSLKDTQTGLRSIPSWLVKKLIDIDSGGYQFEMHMLLFAAQQKIAIGQTNIATIYMDQNRTSHFNPLWDSLKIYFLFLRYSIASILSAAVDLILFFMLFHLTYNILLSTVTGRIVSSIFNFSLNRKVIFKSTGRFYKEIIEYSLLALFSVLLSYVFVTLFYTDMHMNIYISKILADCAIFMFNFFIQKLFIFRKRPAAKKSLATN